MLEYDNSAFYYFAMTLMCMYLLPSTWNVMSEVYKALFSSVQGESRTEAEKQKMDRIRTESAGLKRLTKRGFLINLVCLLVTWAIFGYFLYLVLSTEGTVQEYNPYSILGVDIGATTSEIKKAYRKMSLKYHPDKNIGNKDAEEMFKKVAKAHEALTDEVAKENYAKYGNPDGRQQSMEVSIGLPTILLENPKVVLVLYLVGMVIVIPTAVAIWYNKSKQFGEKNIFYDTYRNWLDLVKAETKIRQLPEVLAVSKECRSVIEASAASSGDKNDALTMAAVEPLLTKFVDGSGQSIMNKPKFDKSPTVLKGNILLHAYLHRRTNELSESQRRDVQEMLCKAPELISGMIDMAWQQRFTDTTRTLIKFQQFVVQGLWGKASPLQQLCPLKPFSDDEIKTIEGSFANIRDSSPLRELVALKENQQSEMLKSLDRFKKDAPALADVLKTVRLLPDLEVTLDWCVEEDELSGDVLSLDDDEQAAAKKKKADAAAAAGGGPGKLGSGELPPGKKIHENDLVTIKVKFNRKNHNNGSAHKVLAPLFPRPLNEAWWLILTPEEGTDGRGLPHPTKVTDQKAQVETKLQFMCTSGVGKGYKLRVHVVSDCFCGLDQELSFSFDVNSAAELAPYEAHEEDKALENEPTLFEQVMTQHADVDSSDEEDDEPTPAKGKPAPKKSAAQEQDDGEESD